LLPSSILRIIYIILQTVDLPSTSFHYHVTFNQDSIKKKKKKKKKKRGENDT